MTNTKKYHRLIIKVTKDTLPQVKDRYPFLYLERGRLEVDDSSVKCFDSESNFIRIPIATITTLLLGPGTTVTHEQLKFWVQLIVMYVGSGKIPYCFMLLEKVLLQIHVICVAK